MCFINKCVCQNVEALLSSFVYVFCCCWSIAQHIQQVHKIHVDAKNLIKSIDGNCYFALQFQSIEIGHPCGIVSLHLRKIFIHLSKAEHTSLSLSIHSLYTLLCVFHLFGRLPKALQFTYGDIPIAKPEAKSIYKLN